MPTSNEVRQQFLDFFIERHGHAYAPPVPLPAVGDPTLMFINSGMVQFKDIFLGNEDPKHVRVANSQKCLRVSGKHNDLEDVGRDGTHLTFFEMLGYWSFGDYFKREAIGFIWELLTDVWGLDPSRLYATCFAGDDADGVPRDDEASEVWASATSIDPSHIQFWGKKDNFWEMGEMGPCGPCSEIHIDLTPDGTGGELVNRDDPRVVELGNDVFIQYNRDASGKLSPLPRRHVDFGAGFERILAVLNGVDSVYDTDLFQPIFEGLRDISGAKAYGGSWEDHADIAYRVVGDHVRCVTFAVTDGVLPSNEGAGYVLRRILRRAVRHGRQAFGIDEPFLHRLVPVIVDLMGDAFPELKANPGHVAGVVREEEESFGRTIGRGIELFEQAAARSPSGEISGEDAFKLHDTYGFPLDLTQVMASERGMTVDTHGFEELMSGARELARAASGGTGAVPTLADVVQADGVRATEFLGYEATGAEIAEAPLVCRLTDGVRYEKADAVTAGDEVAVAFSRTPFYAEAGGQVGDTGLIGADGIRVRVTDTQKVGGVIFHLGTVEQGELSSRPVTFQLSVDRERRERILGNHTGTHMMNLALRHVLGPHVDQKGSLVDDEKLRFDLSHHAPVTTDELERIEEEVNADIAKSMGVYDQVVPLDDAMKIRNLRAVFGEKYPHDVRVVAIGVPVSELVANPDNPDWDAYSIELCGGTHLAKTGEAIAFVCTAEEAVAKGVRRVFALTGPLAKETAARGEELWSRFSSLDRSDPARLSDEVASLTAALQETLPAVVKARLRDGLAELQKIVKEHEKELGKEAASGVLDEVLALASGDGEVVVGRVSETDPGTLRAAVEAARGRLQSQALLIGSSSGDTVTLVAAVPKPLVERGLKAGDWVREAAAAAGGKGGGRPDMAQAGAKDPSKLDDALEAARRAAASALSG